MSPLELARIFFCVELGKFSIADFIISKTIDIGSGKLWSEIKKRFGSDEETIESRLYNVIEASIERYSALNDKNEIAPACELIYAGWIIEGKLSKEQTRRALEMLNSRYIAKRNINLWYNIFYEEMTKNEPLYKWFILRTLNAVNNQKSKNEETLEQIKEMLEQSAKENEIKQDSRLKYEKQIKEQVLCPVLGEAFNLQDIYISLHGKIKKHCAFQNESMEIVDTTDYIWNWSQQNDSQILFLHGEPGSGKSSIVKMAAATIIASDQIKGMVIFINLHKLAFSDKESSLKILVSYIKRHSPWFFEETNKEMRILILDGLDEIKYKVYDNALELVRELETCDWEFPYKIIISGRTQIILKSIENVRCEELEILPLYLDDADLDFLESTVKDSQSLLKENLRQEYWDTLIQYFNTQQEMPILNARFNELSKSPLLLFLIVWTIKYSGIQFSEINNAAELYDNIFRYIYTREYNRDSKEDIYFKSKEYIEYQQMLKKLGGCAFRNNSKSLSINAIYEYCTQMGKGEVCQRWIQKHTGDNPSKLVLFFFLREIHSEVDWDKSEIEFIHKTFYEYLAAVEIIEFLYKQTSNTQSNEFLPLMFFLFSKNILSDEITIFIGEIIKNESLEIDGNQITIELFGKCISNIIFWGYHVNYPFCTEKNTNNKNSIYAQSYTDIIQSVKIYENNVQKLLEIVTKIKNTDDIDIKINFSGIEFQNATMPWWIFDNCILVDVHLEYTYLSGASFKNCNLQRAVIYNSIADRADFSHADLSEADFSGAQLSTANFEAAIVKDTIFDLTISEGAYFCDVLLEGTQFICANLTAANFDNAIFRNTNFQNADLTRADLSNTVLENANWENCIMEDAVLSGVKLSQFDLNNLEIIEMLAEANLENSDWTGVTAEQKKMLISEK